MGVALKSQKKKTKTKKKNPKKIDVLFPGILFTLRLHARPVHLFNLIVALLFGIDGHMKYWASICFVTLAALYSAATLFFPPPLVEDAMPPRDY